MHLFLVIIANILQVVIFSVTIFQLIISLAGYKKEKVEKQKLHGPDKTFAILVAAHNEEKVIAPLLENLKNLKYPKNLYEIFVICDNCTDRTAKIAKKHGVHAMERFDDEHRGKGYAVEWMLNHLWQRDRQFDAVVIFDADNLVSENFLQEMNHKLQNGNRVIQAYVETKNPYDSWVTLSYAITYWFMNRLWQQARQNLGMPNTLAGTGMCFESALLKEIGWNATSLTEDVEFTAQCVIKGIYPSWANNAIVYDEKPLTLKSSIRQRVRWIRGHTECARRYMFPLLGLALKRRSFSQLDAAFYLFQPIRFVCVAAVWIMTYLQLATPLYKQFAILKVIPDWGWIALSIILIFTIPTSYDAREKAIEIVSGSYLIPGVSIHMVPNHNHRVLY